MSRTFDDRRLEAGMPAMQDLIDRTALDLDGAIETHGAHSIEAARQHLILALMRYQIGDFEGAEPHIWTFVTVSQQKCGPNSAELFTGLILLSINCIGWRPWAEETLLVFDRLKLVSRRCHERRDPMLEGLYDAATRYQDAGDPASRQRGFILFLMALSWCVRHQSDAEIYEQFFPILKTVFASYGFVGDHWEWLVKHSNPNLHDIVGLISVFLDKRILPADVQPPPMANMREWGLHTLAKEFPVRVNADLRQWAVAQGGQPVKLQFRCPRCGSWDLRTMFMEPYYPISTLDSIEVDQGNVDLCDLNEREPSEYEGQGHSEGWAFWCDKCHLMPHLDVREEEMAQEKALARWLLENCPQEGGLSASATSHSEG